ncbi:hypothetical protein ONS96_005277 [Cadophora gregata f. sp. sojae]|nr:hypothetical protein ONS96_005277 [Cadophora gregata f. sp. sojae]
MGRSKVPTFEKKSTVQSRARAFLKATHDHTSNPSSFENCNIGEPREGSSGNTEKTELGFDFEVPNNDVHVTVTGLQDVSALQKEIRIMRAREDIWAILLADSVGLNEFAVRRIASEEDQESAAVNYEMLKSFMSKFLENDDTRRRDITDGVLYMAKDLVRAAPTIKEAIKARLMALIDAENAK